jgi:hypothetical protein
MNNKIMLLSSILILFGCSTEQNEADKNICSVVTAAVDKTKSNMWECLNYKTASLTDKSTSANDIATAVIYQCNNQIAEVADANIENIYCAQSRESGRSIAHIKRLAPMDRYKFADEISLKLRSAIISDVLQIRSKKP